MDSCAGNCSGVKEPYTAPLEHTTTRGCFPRIAAIAFSNDAVARHIGARNMLGMSMAKRSGKVEDQLRSVPFQHAAYGSKVANVNPLVREAIPQQGTHDYLEAVLV